MPTDTNNEQDNGNQEEERIGPPIGSMAWQNQQPDADTIDFLVESDLDDRTLELLENLLGRDIPLGNLSEEELHEFRWLLENREMEVLVNHPPEESIVQGALRQSWLDDERRRETALTLPQRKAIREVKEIIKNRARRGRNGWQQQEISKQRYILEQTIEDDTKTDDDGLLPI